MFAIVLDIVSHRTHMNMFSFMQPSLLRSPLLLRCNIRARLPLRNDKCHHEDKMDSSQVTAIINSNIKTVKVLVCVTGEERKCSILRKCLSLHP